MLAQAADDPDAKLDSVRLAVEEIERRLQDQRVPMNELPVLRRRLLEFERQANSVAAEQAPLLASGQARLDELGKAATEGEAPDVTEQRKTLQKSVAQIDARIRLARLLVVTSEQLADKTAASARQRFAAELSTRTDMLLSPTFFRNVRAGIPSDMQRLDRLGRQFKAWVDQIDGRQALLAAATFLIALLLRWPIRAITNRLLVERTPAGRLRRSLRALATALGALLLPLGALLALLSLTGEAATRSSWESFALRAGAMACFCFFVFGLLHGLLAAKSPSWRLPVIPDEVAMGMRLQPLWLASTLFAAWLLRALSEVGQFSLYSVIAAEAVASISLALVTARAIRVHERLWRQLGAAARPWWIAPLLAGAWSILGLAIAAMLAGYVALGSAATGQVVWTFILLCGGYVLNAVIKDAVIWSASRPPGREADDPQAGDMPARHAQIAVVAAGLLQVLLAGLLLVLVFAPYGEGPAELVGRAARWREGLTIGNLQVRPAAVLNALLVVLLSLAAVRVLRRWTTKHLLPTMGLDLGMQNSISALLGFIGGVVAVAMGLSAMGLALNQVAWIASALTVGIGFGLQAIVSNFVSGLILLAERPVKVGDWVAIAGLEGDIVRINVRATEIQMADRSTLIVPNSEFITKVVRNVTHDVRAQGLVQIKLPLPLDVDPEHVRRTILAALEQHEDILPHPPPRVLLDGVEADRLVFSASGLVASPRRVAITRSEVLLRVLSDLKENGQQARL
ncbi:MAG TPA: DUF3772 domain-containing protein [Ramlibacter sp.]|uniref:DUF3772 domain-containing protein n=1 Tax=Ramlibacter sp. TaxID=1917967 RepID=UPI002D641279|nr:DUF3772 domain-containing protein [Ramlibacter sp.]HZY19197.1 DUF3772 domain-containing protein [Ramlibacter sp.]